MKCQFKLGRLFGIDVYVHATFLLIIGFVALQHWALGPARVVDGILFVLAIFACVVAHEYGHALAARRFGVRTRDSEASRPPRNVGLQVMMVTAPEGAPR